MVESTNCTKRIVGWVFYAGSFMLSGREQKETGGNSKGDIGLGHLSLGPGAEEGRSGAEADDAPGPSDGSRAS